MRTRLPLLGALVCLSLVPAAAADARRTPTEAERDAIAQATKTPSRCSKIYVSTINERYASAEFNHQRLSTCRRYASNGIGIYRRRSGRWRYISGMSDCLAGGMRGVPDDVYRDLTRAFCRPKRDA